MMKDVSSYATLIFDCDGVVLDSNAVKTEAFYKTALEFGQEAAERLVHYHRANGGISRYKKFEYFLANVIAAHENPPSVDELVSSFAEFVKLGLTRSDVEPNLAALKAATSNSRWLIVSGGAQHELRAVFREKGIDELFENGIFGSPDSKEEILEREIKLGNIAQPALFIGDSKYDYLASNQFNIDFVFVSQWTEFSGWSEFCRSKNLLFCRNLADLMELDFD